MTSSGISGLSVGIVTIGSVLVYAGMRGVSPLQALRDVSTGKPPAVTNIAGLQTVGNVAQSGQLVDKVSIPQSAVTSGITSFNTDKYSQLRRTQDGYSDCSSFVCKIYHLSGVAKPDGRMTWPNTTAFANSPAWKTITQAETMPGDIAVVSGKHMVLITANGGAQAIGQQNNRSNVRTGTIQDLFYAVTGSGSGIVYRTYVG